MHKPDGMFRQKAYVRTVLGKSECRVTLLIHLLVFIHCLYVCSIHLLLKLKVLSGKFKVWWLPLVAELMTISKQVQGNYRHFNGGTNWGVILLQVTPSTQTLKCSSYKYLLSNHVLISPSFSEKFLDLKDAFTTLAGYICCALCT